VAAPLSGTAVPLESKAIATASGGRFWYINESQIEDIIEEEFQGSLSVLIDRPRVGLVLPTGVVVARDLNALPRIAGKYRIRPLKGTDVFNFAVRLEVSPERIENNNFTFSALLYDADRHLLQTDRTVPLVPLDEFVVSPSQPLVRSIVKQIAATTSTDAILQQIADRRVSETRPTLVAKAKQMRELRDEAVR